MAESGMAWPPCGAVVPRNSTARALPQRVCPDSADLCTGVRARGGQVYDRYWDCEARQARTCKNKANLGSMHGGHLRSHLHTLQLHAHNS